MMLSDALLLVRQKYLEEQKTITQSSTAEQYKAACAQFPATMTVAHHLWARELMKNLP